MNKFEKKDNLETVIRSLREQSRTLCESLLKFETRLDLLELCVEQVMDVCPDCGCQEFKCGHNVKEAA